MLKNNEYYEFMPSMMVAMTKPPAFYVRIISMLIMLFMIIVIAWLCFSKVDIVVTAHGKIIPSGKIKIVQAADEGVVRKIHVTDGQIVNSGDPLIELDSTNSEADELQLLNKFEKSTLTVQRLQAELGETVELGIDINSKDIVDTEKALLNANLVAFSEKIKLLEHEKDQVESAREVIRFELKKLNSSINYYSVQLKKKKYQAANGLIAGIKVDEAQFKLNTAYKEKEVLEKKIAESEVKLATAKEKLSAAAKQKRSELYKELSDAKHALKSSQQDLIKAQQRSGHQILRAPVDGVVQQLVVNTIGAVVSRAEKVLVLVPEDTHLEMEAQILNKDIGFVDTNQATNVKIDAFEYTRYGVLEGDLDWVGKDAIVDEEKGPIYPARVKILQRVLPRKVNNKIATVVPGMSATADIIIGQRRLIEYFLGPILRYKDESLNER